MEVTNRWKNICAGFFFNTLASNVYILPIFSYIGQLANPDHIIDIFSQYYRNRLFGGPGNWLPPEFLEQMSLFGFPAQLRDLKASILASKVRVASTTQLDLVQLSSDIGFKLIDFRARTSSEHPWHIWHSNILILNQKNFQEAHGCISSLIGPSRGAKKKFSEATGSPS